MHERTTYYDYPGMSNVERLAGRYLQDEDNGWFWVKVFFVILGIIVIYFVKNGDINIGSLSAFYHNYLG